MGTGSSPSWQAPNIPAALLMLGIIVFYVILAILVSLFSRTLARPIVAAGRRLPRNSIMAPARQKTLESLIASLISLLAFLVVLLAIFSLFVDSERLIWIIGLFSAAFGLAARSLVADILAGTRFIFRNTFAIDEKVELNVGGIAVEGIVEEVNVTNTLVRAQSGEAYVVPNGDITVIRNFSRAPYSSARIKLAVKSEQLAQTVRLLEELSETVIDELPALTDPFQVISTSDNMGSKVELTIMAHCSYAKAATVKFDLESIRILPCRTGC